MRTKMCVLGAITALTLAACSGNGDADGSTDTETDPGTDTATGEETGDETGELTEIMMGVLPIGPSAALQLGVDEGIFEDHGFDVTLESGQGGAALLPAVVSGQMEFAISNPLSIMLARGEGLDVRMVTGYSHALTDGVDINSIMAMSDTGISSPADLEGKTVAVNTLRTMGEVSINETLAQAGGDPSSIEYVEMGFPDMPAALESGNIDVAWVPEPFQTILQGAGAEIISHTFQDTMPGVATMAVITSGDLVESDPDLVQRFVTAVDEVTAFSQDNPDLVRDTMVTFLEMDEGLAQVVLLEGFGAEMDREAMQSLADLSLEYGVLSEPVDMDSFMP